MQTKQQIQQLLASAGFSPNKRRGQNFLIDLNLMRLLVASANIYDNDVVLEVGCGTGSLTEALVEHAGWVIAVEIDSTLAKITKKQLADKKNVEVIISDVLESKNTIDHAVISALKQARKEYSGRLLLISNLPYSIACPVMMNLTTGLITADAMYVTVQKEVADRMIAQPNSKHYGILSIFLNATGYIKTELDLKPTVFWPQPQVDSAIVTFIRDKNKADRIHNIELLSELVNLFMNHRRKMLKACTKFTQDKLTDIRNWAEIFNLCSIDPHSRPEQLSAENYIAIANLCAEYLKPK